MKRLSTLLAALVTSGFISACNDTNAGKNGMSSETPQQSIIGEWNVETLNGQQPPENANVSINFTSEGAVNGSSGCNRYFGNYTSPTSGQIELGPLGMTRRACVPPLGQIESQFGQVMQGTVSYQINADGLLILTSANGQLTASRL